MPLTVLLSVMSHETNTFSPVVTDLARFEPIYGEDVQKSFSGTRTGLGGFLDVIARHYGADVKLVTPIAARSPPSAAVLSDAYEHIAAAIVDGVRQSKPDAIMLGLHGAMAVENYEDGEGELLRRIREVAPTTPIAITLDMHCNMYEAIAAGADTLAGYFTVRGGGRSSMPLLREKGGVHRARPRRRRRRACGPDAPLVPARSTRTRISTRRRCAPARRWCACSRARRSP